MKQKNVDFFRYKTPIKIFAKTNICIIRPENEKAKKIHIKYKQTKFKDINRLT